MEKIFRVLYEPYKWLVYIPLLVLSTMVFATLAVLLAIVAGPRISSLIGGTWWSRFNSYVTPMLVSVAGRENVDRYQSYVITSNHQSHFDIFVLYGWLGIDFKWIMKMELRKVPFLGYACDKVGHIYIDRSNHEAALASINEAKKRIVDGTSVLFFPEGTRGAGETMGDFKKGAFIMAFDLDVPILPVTIINTRNILPPHTLRLFPGRVKMVIHPPVDIHRYGRERIEDLMKDVRSAIQSGLDSSA
ncbi:MAG TPA: 1-acyl-sn-glycerol-3-phosphate acyltransferase [Spirochaetes bacterium]|nr:1-acyl-sn-glycerol-3-phosphate acyltransferase [Spirochaetota bacterium]